MFIYRKLFWGLFLLTNCVIVEASLRELAREFVEQNSGVRSQQLQAQLAYYDYQDLYFQRELNLTASHTHNDDNLENFSGVAAVLQGGVARFPIVSNVSTIGLSKEFNWGGTLSLDNTFQKTSLEGFIPVYGFVQAVTYSQSLWRDAFGRNYRDSLASGELGIEESKLQSREQIDRDLMTFVDDFLTVSLNKTLVFYQKEAIERGRARLKIVKRRVNNGLNENVDFLQSRVALLNQEELLKARERDLNVALERVTSKIHRPIEEREIDDFRKSNFAVTSLPEGDIQDSVSIKRLEALIKRTQVDYKRSGDLTAPELTLSATVRNNDFDIARNESISQGFLGGDNRELNVALNFTWAIGSRREKNERARRLLQKEVALYELKSTQKSLEQTHQSLLNQIKLLRNNIDFVKGRIKLTQKALKEYEKLYRRGRADFDQVLQAEEDLIQTQSDYARYYVDHERLIYNLANIYGSIRQKLALAKI